jgi:epsilon-lactone hydrolase
MAALWFLLDLCLSALQVSRRRLLRGPLRPGWSWGFEVMTRAQKRFSERVGRRTPLQQRQAWNSLRSKSPALAQVRFEATTLADAPGLWVTPLDLPLDAPTILYLHGGSFIYGSEATHGDLCARIALASRARLLLLTYSLAPERPFPAASQDVLAAYQALLATGMEPSRLVVMGDSAGGNLALTLLVALRDAGTPLPARAVAICPWVDLSARGGSLETNELWDWSSRWMLDSWAEVYLGKSTDPQDPRVSPHFADLTGLPPLLLLVGGAELLRDQVLAFADQARASGVEVTTHVPPDMVHLWLSLASMFPQCQTDIELVGRYVSEGAVDASASSPTVQPRTSALPQ